MMGTLHDKSILLISPEPWGHIFVSKHHYATHLANRSNQVFFLNPPSQRYGLEDSGYNNLAILNYPGFWKGLYKMPRFLRKINLRQVYRELEQLAGVRFDIIWAFDNSVFFDLDELPKDVLTISHIVDLNQDFNTRRASTSADLCFGVIPEIVERHKQYNHQAHLIRHAFNQGEGGLPQDIELPGKHDFKVLYFGNLAMKHLNWDLIGKALPIADTDFIFLGSGHEAVPEGLKNNSNVHLLSPVPSAKLPAYMKRASALILFYRSEYFKDYASPHKVLEYFSSGKPILAMKMDEYAEQQDLVLMASSDEQWLQQLIDLKTNYANHHTQEKAAKREAYALKNTYQARLEEIEGYIEDYV